MFPPSRVSSWVVAGSWIVAGSWVVVAAACAPDRVQPPSGDRPAPVGRSAPSAVLGPMIGHVTDESARIWIELDRPGTVTVELEDADGDLERGSTALPVAGVALVDVPNLKPRTTYAARFTLDGMPIEIDPPLAVRTFPRSHAPARVRIVLVSCARVPWDSIQRAWTAVAAENADAVLWLGDNGYLEHADSVTPADYESVVRTEFRYRQLRALPSLQAVLRTSANYAIWDDRDYGGSDSDRTHPLRLEVTEIFERYWANPSYGVGPGLDGIFGRARVGPVEVFLLDDRFWRDPDSLPPGPAKTVLGEAQKVWLERSLAESDALLKIVAIGHQVLADYHRYESYAMFAHERREILEWIRRRRVEGVVFVSGDRHLSELMRAHPQGMYPLYELTASPIANRPFPSGLEHPNPIRVAAYADGDSYGVVEFDTTVTPARLTLLVKDAEGAEVVRHETTLDELRFGG